MILTRGPFFKINKTIGTMFEVKGEERRRTKLLIRRVLRINSVPEVSDRFAAT